MSEGNGIMAVGEHDLTPLDRWPLIGTGCPCLSCPCHGTCKSHWEDWLLLLSSSPFPWFCLIRAKFSCRFLEQCHCDMIHKAGQPARHDGNLDRTKARGCSKGGLALPQTLSFHLLELTYSLRQTQQANQTPRYSRLLALPHELFRDQGVG